MKKILAIVAFMFMGGVAHAAGSSEIVPVIESSITVRNVLVSSSAATDVSANIEMPDRTVIALQNKDTNDVYCSFDSADLASHFFILYANGGRFVINMRPWSGKNAAPLKIWCKSSSTSGPSGIAVIQGY